MNHPDPIGPGFQPVPLEDQIKVVEGELAFMDNALRRQVQKGTAAPEWKAVQMHRMRSVLHTLRQLSQTNTHPAREQDPQAKEIPA